MCEKRHLLFEFPLDCARCVHYMMLDIPYHLYVFLHRLHICADMTLRTAVWHLAIFKLVSIC